MTDKENNNPDPKAKLDDDDTVSIPDNHSVDPKTPGTRPGDSTGASQERSSSDSGANEGQPGTPPDPFDPARLRISQNFAETLGVKKVLTTLPCRKPNRHEWVRVRDSKEWRLETVIFEDRIHRETYLLEPGIVPELLGEAVPVCLVLAVNRQSDPFLWQVKLPGNDGRSIAWHSSALEAAQLAQSRWVRVSANMTAGYYDVFEATVELPEPVWPDLKFPKLLETCFRDRFIRDRDDIVIKQLRGEA